jgi:hypothetical protein
MTENLYSQLAKAQAEFTAPKRTKEVRGSYSFSYAPLDEVLAAVRPALGKYGLFLTQGLVSVEGVEQIRTAVYFGTEYVENFWPLINTDRGAQKHGGAGTFARRYGISSLLGLAPEDDDDTNGADNTGNQVQDQRAAPAGKPTNGTSKIKPLPTPPPKPSNFNEVYNPETGEIEGVKPQPIKFEGDWIEWGRRFVAEVTGTRNRATAEAWITQNQDNLDTCEKEHAAVFKRISANIGTMRDRLPWPAEPQFMEAQ